MDLISYKVEDSDIVEMEKILEKLVLSTYIDLALIGDEGGRLVAFVSPNIKDEKEASRLCVVSAGVLGALDQLNHIIHEKNSFFTEGINKSIYIKLSQNKFFLASIFDKKIPLGSVKLFTDKAISSLEPMFEKIRSSKKEGPTIKFDMLEI
jgi:predicted regulator of Ras-like GTPase activity (Roadblock/LC7/MglB family)